MHRVWLFTLGKYSAPSGRGSWSVLATSLVCFVFAIGYLIFMFMPFTVTQGTMVHFMSPSLTLWLGCNQLMIRQPLSLLVLRMLITMSGWSQSLQLIDMGVMLLISAICPTLSAGNRLDLAMIDDCDIVDVVVGTPPGTSDHCFVSFVLRVEQSVPEYNVRSTVFLKHRTKWNIVRSAVRSFTWCTIFKSADLLVAFDRAIGEVIGWYVPTAFLCTRSGEK